MRPIKFRAWDKIRSSMQTSKRNLITFDGHVMPQGRADWADGRYILMQFTGLLDKNGKEIYEGDVVLLWDEPDRSQVIDNLQQAHTLMSECILSDSCRVIGNIYDNPKLLEAKE